MEVRDDERTKLSRSRALRQKASDSPRSSEERDSDLTYSPSREKYVLRPRANRALRVLAHYRQVGSRSPRRARLRNEGKRTKEKERKKERVLEAAIGSSRRKEDPSAGERAGDRAEDNFRIRRDNRAHKLLFFF